MCINFQTGCTPGFLKLLFKPNAEGRHAPGFLKLLLSAMSVCAPYSDYKLLLRDIEFV